MIGLEVSVIRSVGIEVEMRNDYREKEANMARRGQDNQSEKSTACFHLMDLSHMYRIH